MGDVLLYLAAGAVYIAVGVAVVRFALSINPAALHDANHPDVSGRGLAVLVWPAVVAVAVFVWALLTVGKLTTREDDDG